MKGKKLLSDIAFFRTYSAVKSDGTKETWDEVCDRYETMLLDKYSDMQAYILGAMAHVRAKRVLPSMRALQFAGSPILRENARLYNCSFLNVTSFKDFADAMYLSACGTGVGYSVQHRHIEQLPVILPYEERMSISVNDSREGWADSMLQLLQNPKVTFDYSQIRPAGTRLSTGGTASGPEPLRKCHILTSNVLLGAVGRKLTPFEVHKIMTYIADAIVAGGVRRSAMICLFDRDDKEMLNAKSGEWWLENPSFARANNSAVLPRATTTQDEFNAILEACYESKAGEPGIFWTNDVHWGTNPCVPAGTQILTKNGYQNIEKLVGSKVDVWNGFEWSEVSPAITGYNQPLVKVTLSSGQSLVCTTAHKWVIQDGFSRDGEQYRKQASELVKGDKLIKHDLPVIDSGLAVNRKEAYTQGFVSADGMDDYNFCWLYNDKKDCAERMMGVLSGKELVTSTRAVRNKITFSMKFNEKTFVPFEWNIESRLEWLAGYLDGDGCVLKEGGLQAVSTNRQFLLDLQKMLTTMGVTSKVRTAHSAGSRTMPDGKGGYAQYDCQETHRILIGSTQAKRLVSLGLKTERLVIDTEPNRDASQFVTVESVEPAGVADVVYCFTESKRNLGCFEGIVTGQCAEIALRSRQFCNLTEINVAAAEDKHALRSMVWAATVLGTLQAGFTDFNYIHPDWKKNAEEDALLGVGMTGQAERPDLMTHEILSHMAEVAKFVNESIADMIGINPAKRIGTVKPSGTTSTVLGTTSGVHAAHANHYIRRIRIGKDDPLAIALPKLLPAQCIEHSNWEPNNIIVKLPVSMRGLTRHDETAIELGNRALVVRNNWISGSHRDGQNYHNVSLTINYKESEREELKQWMWDNREYYGGISLLPFSDATYDYAPFEECSEELYEYLENLLPILNISAIVYEEKDDGRSSSAACEGGLCTLPLKGF